MPSCHHNELQHTVKELFRRSWISTEYINPPIHSIWCCMVLWCCRIATLCLCVLTFTQRLSISMNTQLVAALQLQSNNLSVVKLKDPSPDRKTNVFNDNTIHTRSCVLSFQASVNVKALVRVWVKEGSWWSEPIVPFQLKGLLYSTVSSPTVGSWLDVNNNNNVFIINVFKSLCLLFMSWKLSPKASKDSCRLTNVVISHKRVSVLDRTARPEQIPTLNEQLLSGRITKSITMLTITITIT